MDLKTPSIFFAAASSAFFAACAVIASFRRLGHANTAITLNVYAHALKSKDTEAADKIAKSL